MTRRRWHFYRQIFQHSIIQKERHFKWQKNSLEAIRAQLLANQKGRGQGGNTGGDNASYQFWNIADGQAATVRFLPDKDENNPLFWVARMRIKLPFAGATGPNATDKTVYVDVPCTNMWQERTCPITAAISSWWKTEKEELAKVYYRKQSWVFQGFVVSSPMDEPNKPENPIRRFIVGKSIYEIIHSSIMDPEMIDVPTDFDGGRDFIIRKTRQGQWPNYGTSNWSLRTRSLNANEQEAVEKHGLWDLKQYLGTRPDDAGVQMIMDMFRDSLDGRAFNAERYAPYRAFSNSRDAESDASSSAGAAPAAPARSAPPRPSPVRQPVADEPEEVETVMETVTTSTRTAPVASSYDDEPETQAAPAKANPADILARVRAKVNTGSK